MKTTTKTLARRAREVWSGIEPDLRSNCDEEVGLEDAVCAVVMELEAGGEVNLSTSGVVATVRAALGPYFKVR